MRWKPLTSSYAAFVTERSPVHTSWPGVQAIMHPSGYTPDEAAGQGAAHMHCIRHALAQYLRSGDISPEKLLPLETFGFGCLKIHMLWAQEGHTSPHFPSPVRWFT